MIETRSIAVLIRNSSDLKECLRSTIGLALENYIVTIYLLNLTIVPTPEISDMLAWLEDLEVDTYTTSRADSKSLNIRYRTPEEIGRALKDADLVIPFGSMQ
jgi:hypothetical protein